MDGPDSSPEVWLTLCFVSIIPKFEGMIWVFVLTDLSSPAEPFQLVYSSSRPNLLRYHSVKSLLKFVDFLHLSLCYSKQVSICYQQIKISLFLGICANAIVSNVTVFAETTTAIYFKKRRKSLMSQKYTVGGVGVGGERRAWLYSKQACRAIAGSIRCVGTK